nr:putative ribonuclease H-like domain-containing protein [Tanacetum cinerariifolium]
MLSRISFHVLIRQGSRCVFSTFSIVFRPFKTLCFFNYALILRQDYDITSSLRRGALQKKYGIFISQEKYVAEILKKFRFTEVKTASTPMETQKPLLKDEDSEEVDVHMYRSIIGSLMYLTSSRPDIMFAVCVYARYQVNLKVSYLRAVKRILVIMLEQDWIGSLQQELVNSLDVD